MEQRKLLMIIVLLKFLLFLQLSWLTSSASTPLPLAKPGCDAKCGNLTIPVPFGIGPNENGCSLTGPELFHYNITCDTTYNPPKPFLRVGRNTTAGPAARYRMVEVLSISDSEVRIKNWPATSCYQYKTGELTLDEGIGWMAFNGAPFTISYTRNKFFGLGCDTLAYFFEPDFNFNLSCISFCQRTTNIIDGSCSGSGCCQTPLPKGVRKFLVLANSMNTSSDSLSFAPCSYSFIGESEKYTFSASDLNGTSFHNKAKDIPVVLDWALFGLTLASSSSSDPSFFRAKAGCDAKCGNISIPYPFGIITPEGYGCSIDGAGIGYQLSCNTSFQPPKLFLGTGSIEITDISETELRITTVQAIICYNKFGNVTLDKSVAWSNISVSRFTFSYTKNVFFAIGCKTYAFIDGPDLQDYSSSCSSNCNSRESVMDGSCFGQGCCQSTIPKGLNSLPTYQFLFISIPPPIATQCNILGH
ncbi:hypothetical protein MKW98_032013 [Papaver atlanticum]|uniref:Wall-associated receptor kinase galacturonan-binding domain-containing protein n=1 Tax=Papaver atlanticum TaxID=357466 RepID=A0AAD4XD34_9MAGN|nr:hypothetical protein MKW98_032013 [Papaver atlanticum]